MRRLGLMAVAAGLVAGLVGGCAGSDPAAKKEQGGDAGASITVGVRKGDNNVVPALADKWNEQNPDRPVVVELLDGNADQQRQQFSLELSAQSPDFDVVGLDVTWAGEFAKNGWIAPLTSLEDQAIEDIYPGPLETGMYKGDLYAVPLLVGAGLLYYRTDLVDAPPATWEELSEVGRNAAAGADISPLAAQGAAYEGMVTNYLEYLWANGGDLFNEDYTEATLNKGDAGLKALEFMRNSYNDELFVPGYSTMTEAEARPAFEGGDVVFMRHWAAPYLPMSTSEDSEVVGKFDIAPLPGFGDQEAVSALGGLNLAVNEFSDKQDMAAEFISWATMNPQAQAILLEEGVAPAAKAAYADAENSDNRVIQVLAEVLPPAKARPALPEWGEISSVMSREIFEAYTGQKDPESALATMQETLEKAAEANRS